MLNLICYLILTSIVCIAVKITANKLDILYSICQPLISKIFLLILKINKSLVQKEKTYNLLLCELETCKDLLVTMREIPKNSRGFRINKELLFQKLANTKDLFMTYNKNQHPENILLTIKLFNMLMIELKNHRFDQDKQQLFMRILNQLENKIIHFTEKGV